MKKKLTIISSISSIVLIFYYFKIDNIINSIPLISLLIICFLSVFLLIFKEKLLVNHSRKIFFFMILMFIFYVVFKKPFLISLSLVSLLIISKLNLDSYLNKNNDKI